MVSEVFPSSGLNLTFKKIEIICFSQWSSFRAAFHYTWCATKVSAWTTSIFDFINDLRKVSKSLNFYLFADDTDIYYESSDLLNIQKIVNRELRKVRKWLEAIRLALNIDKMNFVLFHSSQRNLTEHIVLKIGNKKLKQSTMYVFLVFYWILPLVGSSTSLNCQKNLQEQLVFFTTSGIMLHKAH